MRPPVVVRAVLATLALSTSPALAQGTSPALSRTLTVPRAPDSAPAPPLHLRSQMATTLEFDFPVHEPRLSGPGGDAVAVQQLEPHVLSLYPSRALGPWQAPTLTLTAEDGARYVFSLVMDGSVDVKVRVQRGECPPLESNEAAATRLLLRLPAEQIREVAFHRLGVTAELAALTLKVEGTIPLAPHALLLLTLTEENARTFAPGDILISGPAGPLRVLGQGTPDKKGAFSAVVERPEGHPQGAVYTLTLQEKDGPRQLVAERVTPWPLAPPSPEGDVLGPQERPKGGPDATRHRKVPGPQRLQPH